MLDKKMGTQADLEQSLAEVESASRGMVALLDDMEERWCSDARYYALLALARQIVAMAAHAVDTLEELQAAQ